MAPHDPHPPSEPAHPAAPATPDAAVPRLPSHIGRYLVLEVLGTGGMGVVYAAYDPELDRKVALKVMDPESDVVRVSRRQDYLRREAQALARLAHPNIVAIHDVGVVGGRVFVAMEFVAGRTLRQWWQETRPGWQEVVAAMVQAGNGIVAAHAAGLVHRDIKPDNLLLGADGRVRVADFGIVRFEPGAEVSTLGGGVQEIATVAGRHGALGTPAYMSPEQHADRDVGPASDQFSFCVTLYEGLHGQRPYRGETGRLAAAMRAGPPTRPPGAPVLPTWLDQALRRGLAPEPADRWPSMQALLDVLAVDPELRRARRRWRLLQFALLVLGLVALVLGGKALQASMARRAAEQAATQRFVGVAASVERLLARGLRADAEAALRAFIEEPEHRDSGAVIDALLLWAGAMEARHDPRAALAVLVEAYMALPAEDPREAGIALQIGRQFAAQWRFQALAGLASQVLQRWPEQAAQAEWVGLRADAALARGDLPGFVAAVDTGAAGPQREAVAPLVRALAPANCIGGGFEHAYLTDLAADGRPEVLTLKPGVPRTRVTLHRMDAGLTPLGAGRDDLMIDFGWVHQLPLTRSPGGPAYVVGHDPAIETTALFELGPGEPRELLRWEDHRPQASAAADLDGDGLREIYLGTGTYTRKLYRIEPDANGVWIRRPAHEPTDRIASDINSLAAGDFDGDGREELAVVAGAWRAYDVRILEADPDGALQIGARRRIGHVRGSAALRGADGATLLALAKDDTAPSTDAFAAGEPQGDPAGLYIVRRRGATLETVAHLPWPSFAGAPRVSMAMRIHVGDLDGDGLQDLAVVHDNGSPFATLLLVRQHADGRFTMAQVGGLRPALVGNFDDDPADELLVETAGGENPQLCVLGVAGDPPPPLPIQSAGSDEAVPALADPLLARIWARAENLARFGLSGEAARALEQRITQAAQEVDRQRLRRRVAELFAAAGDTVAAGDGFEALALGGDVDAALLAIANHEQGLRLDEALRVAESALRREAGTTAQRQALAAASQRLRAVVDRRDHLELRFDGPLAPGWQVQEPLALRVDPVRDELVVDATAELGELATFPIVLTGEPLTLEIDLEVERAEWGARVAVALRPRDGGPPALSLGVGGGGGGGYLQRSTVLSGAVPGRDVEVGTWQTESAGLRSEHRARVQLLSGHGRLYLEETADHAGSISLPVTGVVPAGEYLLVLRATGNVDFDGQKIRARIRRIAVVGARPDARDVGDAPPGDVEVLARALVLGDWQAALRAGQPLWRGVALAELGRSSDAVAALAGLDADDPGLRRQLRYLLRVRSALFAPLLRAALGPRYAALLAETLTSVRLAELDDERLQQRLDLTVDLEAFAAEDAAEPAVRARLHEARGVVRKRVGDLEGAEQDLALAVALGSQRVPVGPDDVLATLELLRAEVATRRQVPELALAAAARALARASDPAWMAERLRISGDLRPLHADRRWQALLSRYP
jgi:predicted Ser/Thr protein kinase